MRFLINVLTLFFITTLQGTAVAQHPAFFDTLKRVCGQRYVGEMTYPESGQDSFAGKRLVAEIQACTEVEIRIPFAVGENQSRTWILRRTADGLELKHDHRHSDGSPDEITNYGGMARIPVGPLSASFPADHFTAKLIPAAATNVWTLSLSEDQSVLTYHLTRHNRPRFTAVLKRAG